jgi:hypothetical protein
MRKSLSLAAILTLAVMGAVAQTIPALPPGAAATEARLMTKVGPQTRAFIRQEAAGQRGAATFSDTVALERIGKSRALGQLREGDIDALAFLVMMEAAKSAQEDLKSIMDGVKAINDAKVSNRPTARTNSVRPHAAINRGAISVVPRSKQDIDNQIERSKGDVDSMSEMGEMESLRLQMAMDRMLKMMSTLSNLLKKMSDTNTTITQNLK